MTVVVVVVVTVVVVVVVVVVAVVVVAGAVVRELRRQVLIGGRDGLNGAIAITPDRCMNTNNVSDHVTRKQRSLLLTHSFPTVHSPRSRNQ